MKAEIDFISFPCNLWQWNRALNNDILSMPIEGFQPTCTLGGKRLVAVEEQPWYQLSLENPVSEAKLKNDKCESFLPSLLINFPSYFSWVLATHGYWHSHFGKSVRKKKVWNNSIKESFILNWIRIRFQYWWDKFLVTATTVCTAGLLSMLGLLSYKEKAFIFRMSRRALSIALNYISSSNKSFLSLLINISRGTILSRAEKIWHTGSTYHKCTVSRACTAHDIPQLVYIHMCQCLWVCRWV